MNNFSVMLGQVFLGDPVPSKDKCVLLKDTTQKMQVRLQPAAPQSRDKHSTTEPMCSLSVLSFDTILSKKRITKVLIRLRRCAGWSAPWLFANPEDRFYCIKAHIKVHRKLYHLQSLDYEIV